MRHLAVIVATGLVIVTLIGCPSLGSHLQQEAAAEGDVTQREESTQVAGEGTTAKTETIRGDVANITNQIPDALIMAGVLVVVGMLALGWGLPEPKRYGWILSGIGALALVAAVFMAVRSQT